MDAWSRLPQQFPHSLVLVAVPSREALVRTCREKEAAVRVLLDPEGETARRYNARWLPRAYALDAHGVLTYAQPAATLDPQAPLAVAALWRGASLLARASVKKEKP